MCPSLAPQLCLSQKRSARSQGQPVHAQWGSRRHTLAEQPGPVPSSQILDLRVHISATVEARVRALAPPQALPEPEQTLGPPGKGKGRTGRPRGGISGPGSALTHCLEVEGNHLASSIPKHLGHVVGGVHASALGVNAAHLAFVVAVTEYRSLARAIFTRRTQQPTERSLSPDLAPVPTAARDPGYRSLKDTPQTARRLWREGHKPSAR